MQGAEAIIHIQDNQVIKQRIAKPYRHAQLDEQLRTRRTRSEVKLLNKVAAIGLKVPAVIRHNTDSIVLEYISGDTLRDVFTQPQPFARQIADILSMLHQHDIIHGDLTTSNMMVRDGHIVLIDFGLGCISARIEDKAVDIHVFEESLQAYHHAIAQEVMSIIEQHYIHKPVLERLAQLRLRGRYKAKH